MDKSNEKNSSAEKIRKIATPYDAKESFGVIIRNAFGANKRKNKGIVDWLPTEICLNENVEPMFTLGVVGDIMDMEEKEVVIDDGVCDFFNDCDYLLGNFEATITSQKRRKGVIYGTLQTHDARIIESLQKLADSSKLYLSVANNHAGDFGREVFFDSIASLKDAGFNIFGWDETPFVDVNEELRIVTGTELSNQVCDYVTWLDNPEQYLSENKFNLLYPHWSNELELWPRLRTVKKGKQFLKSFDAILGHHSHCPQPVSKDTLRIGNISIEKLIAYGLGDFTTGLPFKKYHYGIVMKLDIGKINNELWAVGNVAYQFTQCSPINKSQFSTKFIDAYPYMT